jgi:hypothetical protein
MKRSILLCQDELGQVALTVTADDSSLGDGVVLGPVGAQPLNRLGAVTNEASTLKLDHPEGPHELGLLGWAEILPLGAHDVSNRERVAGSVFPGPRR